MALEFKYISQEELDSIYLIWNKYSDIYGHMIGIPQEWLEDGYCVLKDGKFVCATWLYCSDKFAWLAWTTANPEVIGTVREEGLKGLFEFVERSAKEMGLKAIFTGTNNASLLSRYIDCGYLKTDSDNVHLFKQIG